MNQKYTIDTEIKEYNFNGQEEQKTYQMNLEIHNIDNF